MVEKRVLDKVLVKALRKNEHIKWILLTDKEGFPISKVVRNKQDRIKSQQFSSILRFLYAPANMFSASLGLGDSLVGITFFDNDVLVEINTGNGLLAILHSMIGWPLGIEDVNDLLHELKIYLPELIYVPSGLLKELKVLEMTSTDYKLDDKNISKLFDIFMSLMKGKISKENYVITAGNQDYYIDLGKNIVNEGNIDQAIIIPNTANAEPIYEHNGSAGTMANPTKLLMKAYASGIKNTTLSQPIFHIYFFNNGAAMFTAPISQHDATLVYLSAKVTNWNQGFMTTVSPLYRTLLTLIPAAPSDLTKKLKESLDFFSSTPEDLKTKIDQYLAAGDSNNAINYMERCAKIFKSQMNYTFAGDYYKWIGYTFYEASNPDKSIVYYNKAIEMHRKASDNIKVIEDYSDLGSLLEAFDRNKEAIDYYNESVKLLNQMGDAENAAIVQSNIKRVLGPLSTPIADYLNYDSATSYHLSKLADRFEMPEHILNLALEYLISATKITGFLDMNSRTYSKRKDTGQASGQTTIAATAQDIAQYQAGQGGTGGGQTIVIGGLVAPRAVPQLTYAFTSDQVSKISSENAKMNGELTKLESEFKRRNIKLTDFLKYQTYLNKRKFNDQQITIYDNMLKVNAENGQPILCFVCLKGIESDDIVSVCPNGHGAHDNCLATWIQNQQKCPVCAEKIMPFMLQTTYAKHANSIFNPGYVIALQKELEGAMAKLNFLHTLDPQNLDLFGKATAEREEKRQVEKALNRKEQELQEVKSLLKTYKDDAKKRSGASDDDYEF